MEDFIGDPVIPLAGTFDCRPMAAGLPGLPAAFDWRGQTFRVTRLLDTWKHSVPEGGRPGAERYLRRHYFRLLMSDSSVWTIYFVRHTPRGSAKTRWFLYTRQATNSPHPADMRYPVTRRVRESTQDKC